ncbi:MAG TPA: helix-turn-helix transcriptional regulator [Planctomycetota bacterium]|nr:helix-turn-helix transcriptional regulator [Planctomycetota bacterium]
MQRFDVMVELVHRNRVPGRVFREGSWNGPWRHPRWTLDYCGYPGLRIRVATPGGEVEFERPPGSWHLYPPNVSYWQKTTRTEDSIEQLWVQFQIRGTSPAIFRRPFAVVLDPEERIAACVRDMFSIEHSRRPGCDLILHGMMLQIAGELERAQSFGDPGTPADPLVVRAATDVSGRSTLLDRFDALVTERIKSPPPIHDLARELKMSVSSLAHRFKAETGMTPIERIRWLRVREAKRLLSREAATVKSVAAALRFSSPFYFSRVFKEVTGSTAHDFIAQQRR